MAQVAKDCEACGHPIVFLRGARALGLAACLLAIPAAARAGEDWGPDQWQHVGAMTVCGAVAPVVVNTMRAGPQTPLRLADRLYGAGLCLLAGLGKERWMDERFSGRDMAANAAWVVIGTGLTIRW